MNKHTTIYNLTDQQMRMHAGYQWALGERAGGAVRGGCTGTLIRSWGS